MALLGLDAVRAELSKQLVGTNQSLYEGEQIIWAGTQNSTNALIWDMTTSTFDSGGSVVVNGFLNVGTRSGSFIGWNLTFLTGGNVVVAWSTTQSAFNGSSTGTITARWTVGLGSLDLVYPVFNWTVLGTYIAKEIQHGASESGTLRFAGITGARLFDEFANPGGAAGPSSGTFVTGSRTIATTTGTIATIVCSGISPILINPGFVILYGSIGGTVGTIGQNPIATFRKYISDPIGTNVRGGGWISVPAGDTWIGTFYLEI